MSNIYSRYQIENGVITVNDKDINLIFEDIDKISSKTLGYYFSKNPNIESVSFPDLEIIEDNGLNYTFSDCTNITSVSFPELTTVRAAGLQYAFKDCTNISGSISFPKLTAIDNYGLYGIFQGSTGITSISFPELLAVGDDGLSGFTGSSGANFTTLSFPKLTSLGDRAIYASLTGSTSLTSVSFPELTTIGSASLYYLCQNCTSLTSISFPKLTTIGANGLGYAFKGCTALSGSFSFPKLVNVGDHGLEQVFQNCANITSISFPKLESIGSDSLREAFSGCTGITSISFPKLTTIGSYGLYYAFTGCSNLTEMHFRADAESTVRASDGFFNKFGMNSATVYFDLATTKLNVTPNISGCTIYCNGEVVTNPFHIEVDEDNIYYVYKDGYCLYKGIKNPPLSNDGQTLTDNITMSSTGKTVTLNITIPVVNNNSTATIKVDYIVDGITFKTDTRSVNTGTTQTFTSIKVQNNTNLTYKISADGYEVVLGTVTPSNNTVNITLQKSVSKIIEFAYPFTSNSSYLSNLLSNNNFVILNNTSTPASCIASGPKSYNVDDGFSTGYIKFKTPNTQNEDFLIVTIVCTCSAESSYDYGVVFINTTGAIPSSNVSLTTNAGSIDSVYGEIIYQGYSDQSTTFRTYRSKVLNPNTDYYLCFYYKKDGGVNSGWDRLAIQNIKIPVVNN